MIESASCEIKSLVVHQMGAKAMGGELRLSRAPIGLSAEDEIHDILRLYFFRPFKTEVYYNFASSDGEVCELSRRLFADPTKAYDTSIELARRLFEASNHPSIRGGDFYMAYISNVVVDGVTTEAIGIFKSESKETFLKVMLRGEQRIELDHEEGINIKKLDKGCIIFNMEQEEGYRICAVDNINKGQEAHFWMDDFLGIKPREDNYFYTDNYLKMCKDFVSDVFNEDNNVRRDEQIGMINRSIDYFQKNEKFNAADFEQEVIGEPKVIDAFNEYGKMYAEKNNLADRFPTEFEVSSDAVKSEKKNFKSILKLDKNFHVYVHGSRYLMEKGYDQERDMNYYKLFFRTEQ